VQGRDAGRRLDTDDFLPAQTLVAVHLLPIELTQLGQRIQRGMAFGLLQTEQIALKDRVVQIQTTRIDIAHHASLRRRFNSSSVCMSLAGCVPAQSRALAKSVAACCVCSQRSLSGITVAVRTSQTPG